MGVWRLAALEILGGRPSSFCLGSAQPLLLGNVEQQPRRDQRLADDAPVTKDVTSAILRPGIG